MDSGRAGRRDEENVFMEEEEDDIGDYSTFGQEVEPDGDGRKRVLSFSGKKGSSAASSSSGGSTPTLAAYICQVDYCSANMANAKTYHRRHKVCEFHSKAQVAIVAGQHQRFCQQCSRFHAVSQFDDTKRSCRRRLAGHNQRRRRSSYETQGEGSDEIRT